MGAGPAPGPGPGDRVRHRRLRLQRDASCATPATGRRPPCPLLIDLEGFAGSPDPVLAARLAAPAGRGGADLLFVGKVSPHKGQHDLVKALAAYRRLYDPQARLHIVGGAISEEYQRRRRAVRRRAGPGRRRGDRRLGDPRGAHRLLRRTATSSSACPTTRGSASRCSSRCTTGSRSWPTGTRRSPRRWPRPAWSCPTRSRPGWRRPSTGWWTDDRLRAELAAAAGERVDWFALPRVQDGFAAALEAACAA